MIGRILRTQLLVAVALGAAGLGHGVESAYSMWLGGVICLIASAYFTRRALAGGGRDGPAMVGGTVIRAEVTKLVIVGALFAVVFATLEELNVVAMLLAFTAVHLCGTLAPLWAAPRPGGGS